MLGRRRCPVRCYLHVSSREASPSCFPDFLTDLVMRARIPEKTEASINDGVLTVKMAKKQLKPLLRTHKVEVK